MIKFTIDDEEELRRKEFQLRRTEFFDYIYASLEAAEEEDHNPIDYMLEGIKEEFDKLLEGRNDIN